MTYTYAVLEVTPSTYAEVEEKLRAAGYDHAIEKGVIDMHGLALQRLAPSTPSMRDQFYERMHAAATKLWGEVRDDDRAGLVFAAHELGQLLRGRHA